jgi:iron(III) transport system permease protein
VSFSKMPSFFRSLYYAFIAAIATSVIGLLLSYYIERRRFKGAKSFDLIASLPYIIPGPFFGIGYVLAFNDYPLALTGTGLIVVLNCVFRQIPISTKAASATLSNISTELEDAARDLGASNFRIIRGIIMPLLKPAFLVSFVNTFTATMTTVGAIIFLITPSAKVATVELFNVIREGKYGLAAVLACMIITATLLINVVFSRLLLRETKNG